MYIGPGDDPAQATARHLVECFAADLPDLSRLTVIPANAALVRPLREALTRAVHHTGAGALLGPDIRPLPAWVAERAGPAAPAALSREARELMLFEALASVPRLVARDNRWQFAESLLGLFDELGREHVGLPESPEELVTRLRSGYGIADGLDAPVTREAQLVHGLWQAWHEQLAAEAAVDSAEGMRCRIEAALATVEDHEAFVWVDPEQPARAEIEWFRALRARGQATVVLRGCGTAGGDAELARLAAALGEPPPPATAPDWIGTALTTDATAPPLAERARMWTQPPPRGWSVTTADDFEQEARATALAAVRAVGDGQRRVVIATENRRLARRVRALLERFGLVLADESGWALSTSRAAAVVERWLETIEQEFDHRPLLDVLKSPFFDPGLAGDEPLDHSVFRLERDIILHENVARGLAAYREAVHDRARRLHHAPARALLTLLDRLEAAARPLVRLGGSRARPPLDWLDALDAGLDQIGVSRRLATDEAGERVLDVLDRLRSACDGRDVRLEWPDFRTWLGRALEQEHFVQHGPTSAVILADLARAARLPADTLIITGADAEHIPGRPGHAPFFNDGVRHELGLRTWQDRWVVALGRFHRALAGAGEVIFIHSRERAGEPLAAAPWLDMLLRFHRRAFGRDLADDGLVAAARAFDEPRQGSLPAPTARPAPAAPAELLPDRLSVSRHQHLIACPYRLFAGSCLRLEPLEEVREELQKNDFGELMHLALQAFCHADARVTTPPWQGPLVDERRDQAIAHLETLVDELFAPGVEQRFVDRAWRHQARALVPAFIDWAVDRERQGYALQRTEMSAESMLDPGPVLRGRIDRFDRRGDGAGAVVDYKTGGRADREAMLSGEEVQLSSYALLDTSIMEAAYLHLKRGQPARETVLADAELGELRAAVGIRLARTWAALQTGAAMPAWENDGCTWCPLEGICRRPLWSGHPA